MSDKKTGDKFHIANLDQRTDPALAKRFDVIGDGKAKPGARARAEVSRPKWQPSEIAPSRLKPLLPAPPCPSYERSFASGSQVQKLAKAKTCP
jgi:hypothetical protein